MTSGYHTPDNIEAAFAMIAKGYTPIAGATGLYVGRHHRDRDFVDITRLGLGRIEIVENEVCIGATVTLADLANAVQIPGAVGCAIRKVASSIASAPLRNAITVGGNIAHAVYWADLPVVLLAFDAMVEVARSNCGSDAVVPSERRSSPCGVDEPTVFERCVRSFTPIRECMLVGKKTWDGGLITAVRVPLNTDNVGWGYERFTRTATDYALASACTTMACTGNAERPVASRVRVVLGAVQHHASRLEDIENMLEGRTVTPDLCDEVSQHVRANVYVAPNFRAPAEYRRELAAVLIGRAVRNAWHSSMSKASAKDPT